MGRFEKDTAVTPDAKRAGLYHGRLSPEWEVWGPLGGYVAAMALRALGAATELPRPASIQIAFLAPGKFEDVELEVRSLRRGRRSEALQVRMHQGDREILAATGWAVDDGMRGYEHLDATMPEVPSPEATPSYSERVDDYDDWYPVWRIIDGKPTRWFDEPTEGPPVWHTWMRLFDTPPLDDAWLEAGRSLMWMDLMMWNAVVMRHMSSKGPEFLAPNLDLSVVFHAPAPEEEWLLCDAHAPVASEGIVGCTGRVWTPKGRLLASGTSTLFCRPNPEYPREG